MSVADGVFSGNPFVAIGTALYRGFTSNSVGFGPGGPLRAFLDRVVAAGQPPPPAAAAPSSSSSGTLRTVIDNSPTRPRTPGGPGYRPPSWQVSPLPGPWVPPETDSDFEAFERDTNARWQGFVGPVPTIPDTLPRAPTRTIPRTIPRTLPGVLTRVIALPWLIFYPSRTADDDTVPGPMPQRVPTRGPTRRPRVRVRIPTERDPIGGPRPYFPGDFEREPDRSPDTVSRPGPGTRPQPAPAPSPAPAPRPRTPTRPAPAPTPPPTGLPFWLPLLPQLLPRTPSRLPNRFRLPDTLTPQQPARVEYPQPQPFAVPLQARPSNCPPCETERKRRRRSCTNPISSRRTFTRGGRKYRTITRKLEC